MTIGPADPLITDECQLFSHLIWANRTTVLLELATVLSEAVLVVVVVVRTSSSLVVVIYYAGQRGCFQPDKPRWLKSC